MVSLRRQPLYEPPQALNGYVEAKDWHYISVAKKNRTFQNERRSHHIGTYGPNVIRRRGNG